jgi:hypothetical protein
VSGIEPPDKIRVDLDPELLPLVDRLAERLHDMSAPDPVPYAALPEVEREAERRRAHELIRAILALGFRLRPAEAPAANDDVSGAPEAGAAERILSDARRHAQDLLARGESLLAWETIEEALAHGPGDLRLRQLRGVALARSGDPVRANREMRELIAEGHRDAETLGILARTHKDQAFRAEDPRGRANQLELAFNAYRQGYDAALRSGSVGDAYFTGINAATLSLLLGEAERASQLAKEVQARCYRELEHDARDSNYWIHATLGEAALLLGNRAEAEVHYAGAAERCGARYADLSTTRHQARIILQVREEDPGWLEEILRVPPVAIFTGHMIDMPERTTPRFPPELENQVAGAIRDRIRRLCPVAGYGSAACGADILFLEAMLDEGREFHVILPVPPAEFLRLSVDIVQGGDWPQRFERLLESAASTTVACENLSWGTAATLGYANRISTGMAALHAQRLETGLRGLALWDGERGGGPGGTVSVVQLWEARGIGIERIDIGAAPGGGDAPAVRRARMDRVPELGAGASSSHEMVAIVFADAVGYSKLSDEQIPLFVEHLFGPIAKLIESSPHPPVLKETMGDGLYLVFQHVADAGRFALDLRDLASGIDWKTCGLPPTMSLRIALHCGPVLRLIDPITGQQKYTGPHTSRAARIEPITPPGQVYASQAFAAVVAASENETPVFAYVGSTDLAKNYGSLPLYHVRRATRQERRTKP